MVLVGAAVAVSRISRSRMLVTAADNTCALMEAIIGLYTHGKPILLLAVACFLGSLVVMTCANKTCNKKRTGYIIIWKTESKPEEHRS